MEDIWIKFTLLFCQRKNAPSAVKKARKSLFMTIAIGKKH